MLRHLCFFVCIALSPGKTWTTATTYGIGPRLRYSVAVRK